MTVKTCIFGVFTILRYTLTCCIQSNWHSLYIQIFCIEWICKSMYAIAGLIFYWMLSESHSHFLFISWFIVRPKIPLLNYPMYCALSIPIGLAKTLHGNVVCFMYMHVCIIITFPLEFKFLVCSLYFFRSMFHWSSPIWLKKKLQTTVHEFYYTFIFIYFKYTLFIFKSNY